MDEPPAVGGHISAWGDGPSHSRLVFPGEDGRLVYRPDAQGDLIPDFSSAGYAGGGVALPTVPVAAGAGGAVISWSCHSC